MSLNQSMNISVGSMKNNQYALTVVAHNMANIHTEGYHRQRVNFVENAYTTDCENVIKTIKGMNGASISSLSDFIDRGLFNDVINSNSDAQYYNALADALGDLEGITDDLGDNGLNSLLNDFFKAAANLEQYPADMTIRQQYVMALQNVCEKFNSISKKCDSLQEDKMQEVSLNSAKINQLLSDLASANEAHIKANQSSSTQSAIDNILKELSNYTQVSTTTNVNGTVNVSIGGIDVVEGCKQKFSLQTSFDPTSENPLKFSLKSIDNPNQIIETGITDSFSSGSMKAYIDFLNGSGKGFTNVNDIKSAINIAATAFAGELNEIQLSDDEDGFPASITTNGDGELILEKATTPMFVGGLDAGSITVNPDIINNPFLVAAARIDFNKFKDEDGNIDPNWVKAVGNSDNATKITALQNKKICSYGGGVNNCTLSQFLTNNAAKNGMDIANITSKADTYNDIADNANNNYTNTIGVNIDEELADMIRYQRAYEASAKLFSTINDLMGTIINMV